MPENIIHGLLITKLFSIKYYYNFSFVKEKKSVITVEFALIIIPYLLLFLLTAEICRMFYVSSVINLSLAESSRYAANNRELSYKEAFINNYKKNLVSFPLLANANQISFDVYYCETIEDIISDKCITNNKDKMPLAIYHIDYHYKPVFFILPNNYTNKIISRNLVYVQEYERSNN